MVCLKKTIALFVIGVVLASTSVLALHGPSGSLTQNKNKAVGIAGGYDPYDSYRPSRKLYRASVFKRSGSLVGLALGPRFYGSDRYDDFVTEQTQGSLGTYRKIINKRYDPARRAFRGTKSRSSVLAGRVGGEQKLIPVYLGSELVE